MAEPTGTRGSEEAQRQAVIGQTTATYEGYVESGYSQRWAELSAGMRFAIQDRDRWVVDAVTPALAGTVVDLGCGDGALGVLLDEAGRRPSRLLGLDILEHRLDEARRRVAWAEFVLASADEIPVPDGTASAVVAMTLFSSLTDEWFRRRVAAEIRRVIAPGGRLVVYDLRYPSPSNSNVRPISTATIRELFPGWVLTARTLTLLPPLARSRLAAGQRRYRVLHSLPLLRSHVGMVVVKPLEGQAG